jgi:hypothetical protein
MPLNADDLKALVATLEELETTGLDSSADVECLLVFLQSRRGRPVLELAIQQQMQGVSDEVIKAWLAQAFRRMVESDRTARSHVVLCARRLRVLIKRELAKVPLGQPESRRDILEHTGSHRAKGA